jgi:hypothetical protein
MIEKEERRLNENSCFLSSLVILSQAIEGLLVLCIQIFGVRRWKIYDNVFHAKCNICEDTNININP